MSFYKVIPRSKIEKVGFFWYEGAEDKSFDCVCDLYALKYMNGADFEKANINDPEFVAYLKRDKVQLTKEINQKQCLLDNINMILERL